jgi:hypothetical protein
MAMLAKNLTHYFRVFCVTPETAKDVGDMLTDDIAKKIGPTLQRASREKMLSDGYKVEK